MAVLIEMKREVSKRAKGIKRVALGTHEDGGHLVEDVDGGLGGRLFLGVVGGHLKGCCWLAVSVVYCWTLKELRLEVQTRGFVPPARGIDFSALRGCATGCVTLTVERRLKPQPELHSL